MSDSVKQVRMAQSVEEKRYILTQTIKRDVPEDKQSAFIRRVDSESMPANLDMLAAYINESTH